MNKKFLLGFVALACALFVSATNVEAEIEPIGLDEVVVTATRMNLPLKSIPQKVEIIDRQKILSVPTDNVAELLKRVTNLDIVQYPGMLATIGMRGFVGTANSRSYSVILIDGLPAGTSNLSTIPTSLIERIEVIKGPYSVLYGTDAMGGVINIITRRATRETVGNVTLGGGSFGTTNFTADASGMISERVGVVLGFTNTTQQNDYRIGANNFLGVNETEKKILDEKSYGDIYPNTTFQNSQLFGKLNFAINNEWNIALSSFYNAAYDVKMPGNYFWVSPQKKDINRINLFGNITRTTDRNTFTISPYYSNEKNAFYDSQGSEITNFISSRSDVSEFGIRTNYMHRFENMRLLTGIDMDVWDYKSDRQSAKGTPAAPFRPNNRNQRLSAFTQLNYDWNDLSMNVGARANHITYKMFAHDSLKNSDVSHNYFSLIPSLGLRYNLPNGFNVNASVGQAFSVPDAFATSGHYEINTMFGSWPYRMVFIGNSELKPETSTTYEVGVGYSQGAFNFDLRYFNTVHKNKIITERSFGANGASDTTFYNNAESANMSGLELMASVDFGRLAGWNQRLELYANLTQMFNNTFTEFYTGVKKDSPFVSRSNGAMGLFFNNNRGFSTRLHARYLGSRIEPDRSLGARPKLKDSDYFTKGGYTLDDRMLKHPDHLIFDYSAFYDINNRARIGITVSNLFDENYTEMDAYPMPGRSIMGQVTFTF